MTRSKIQRWMDELGDAIEDAHRGDSIALNPEQFIVAMRVVKASLLDIDRRITAIEKPTETPP